VISETIPAVRLLRAAPQSPHSVTVELENPSLLHPHTPRQDRAPPLLSSPVHSA